MVTLRDARSSRTKLPELRVPPSIIWLIVVIFRKLSEKRASAEGAGI